MKTPSTPLRTAIALAATLASLPLASCADSEPAPQAPWSSAELDLIASLSPLPELPASPSNRYADDPRAARLGQRIFFDAAFSLDGSIACATCHKPALYFTDGQPLAVGLLTPTLQTSFANRAEAALLGCFRPMFRRVPGSLLWCDSVADSLHGFQGRSVPQGASWGRLA